MRFDPTLLMVVWYFGTLPAFLLFDWYTLKRLHRMTFSEWVWEHRYRQVIACGWLAVFGVVLFLHLGFQFLPG